MSMTSEMTNEILSSFGSSYGVRGLTRRKLTPDEVILKDSALDTASMTLYDTFIESWLVDQASGVLPTRKEKEAFKFGFKILGAASINYALKRYALQSGSTVTNELYHFGLLVPVQKYVKGTKILAF